MDASRPSGQSGNRATSTELARTCRVCGFRFTGREVPVMFGARSRECVECIRAQRTPIHWAVLKARNTLRAHAARVGIPVEEFGPQFGWEVARIALAMERAMEAGCHYCERAYTARRELTVDIVNPDGLPLWATNTQVCCARCNQEKQRMSGEAWGIRLLAAKRRARWRAKPIQPGFWDEAA